MGTHLRVFNMSYPMNTNKRGFRWFSKIFMSLCFGVVSTLEGLGSGSKIMLLKKKENDSIIIMALFSRLYIVLYSNIFTML